jgi:hypothetical protein
MIEYIIGPKTTAFFDIWSIEHIMVGVSIGSIAIWHSKKKLFGFFSDIGESLAQAFQKHSKTITRFDIITVLFYAYLWETIEHYLETGLIGDQATYWFQGVEAWDNRFISDPLMLVVGYFIVRRYPKLLWPARVFSATWLLVHIFVFPHSMYLQDSIVAYFSGRGI